MKKKKVLIIGGHPTPAFSVLDVLLKNSTLDFIWVSEKYNQTGNKNPSNEFKTVTELYRIPFISIKTGKLIKVAGIKQLIIGVREIFKFMYGFLEGFIIIIKHRPNIVISFGGFLAVPLVINAKVFRIRVITHEQTLVTGLANKIIAKFADKVLISFSSSEKFFPKNKIIFTGNPIRKDIFQIKSSLTKDLDSSLYTIYITGGNQGAHEINSRMFEIVEKLLSEFNVIHQTGNSSVTNDYGKALQIKSDLPENLKNRYVVKEFFDKNEIGEVLSKADLLISRAGANTVTEILATGKIAILIPIPWASHDEQTKNAKYVESFGLAKVLHQSANLTSSQILTEISAIMQNYKSYKAIDGSDLSSARLKAKESINLDADERIASVVTSFLG